MQHQLLQPLAPEQISGRFFPPVRAWWQTRFAGFTPPQLLAVPAIQDRRHTLVCAPTGSGKTLSAFISVLSDLFARQAAGTLACGIECVYISPLRALGSDIARNLLEPLQQIAPETPLRIAQRTGDTTPAERRRMITAPPQILVTTPESLALCLAQAPMRAHLASVRTIIVDELHSLAGNKRGVDLSLSIERLSALAQQHGGPDPLRIGLSATIAPLHAVADYLVGPARTCAIADASFERTIALDIRSPLGKTPFAKSVVISRNVYEQLEAIVRRHRTTLVFTNTRAATERVVYQLRKRLGGVDAPVGTPRGAEDSADEGVGTTGAGTTTIRPEEIEAHHSSLDREVRLAVEERLKRGELRCVVCSTSLELGIDVGTIDRVVLLNSPKGIARGLQRVGRSGHSYGAQSWGTFIPTVPADLIESVVTAEMMRRRQLDAVTTPRTCLDVLAQQLIGMTVAAGTTGLDIAEAWALVRRTHAYAGLPRAEFDRCVTYVATHHLGEVARAGTRLQIDASRSPVAPDGWDVPTGPRRLKITRRTLAGLYYQNVGTIATEGTVRVKIEDGPVIGTVEESFAQILKPGDRFILGGSSVEFRGSQGMTALVIPSDGQQATVPRWYSGQMGMEEGLARAMREFRARVRAIAPAGAAALARMLMRQWRVDADVANVCGQYLAAQQRYADIPIEGELLVERVPDEDATALVFHAMIGRRAHEAIARVVAYRMHQRFGGNAAVVVDDYAFGVWVRQTSAARRADRALIRSLLAAEDFARDLLVAIEASELFKTQFRLTALRAHAILQNRFGRRRFIGQLQGTATRLYEVLQQVDPEHLLIRETRRTVLEDILSAASARTFLENLAQQSVRILDLPTPSPFAFGLFAAGRRDTLHLADTADFLLAMYEQIQRRIQAEEKAEATLF